MRDPWIGELHRLRVDVIPYARLYGADADTVYLQHTASGEPMMIEEVDTLVTAMGHESVNELAETLEGFDGQMFRIGDCLAPRTCEEAVFEGLRLAAKL